MRPASVTKKKKKLFEFCMCSRKLLLSMTMMTNLMDPLVARPGDDNSG